MAGREVPRRTVLALIAGLVGASVLRGEPNPTAERAQRIERFRRDRDGLIFLERSSQLIGGNWINPRAKESVLSKNVLNIETEAHTSPEMRGVDYVVYTAYWKGMPRSTDPDNPDAWLILDVVERSGDNTYRTDVDFSRLGVPPGIKVSLSFEVVSGKYIKESPSGIHEVIFNP